MSPELSQKVKEKFDLNASLDKQYFEFIQNAARGEFGFSYNYREPVMDVVLRYFSFTLIFVVLGIILQIMVSFSLALISVRNRNSLMDKGLSRLTLIFYSTPVFVSGLILLYIFSYKLGWLPFSGIKSLDHYQMGFFRALLDYASHLILPIISISLVEIAIFYKYLRDNIEAAYNAPYVLFARADGLSERSILVKHIIPNSINPLISIIGIELGVLLGGTLITEVLFGLPGMGRLTISAILTRDYPLIIGCTFISGAAVIAANMAADLLKALIDKRMIKGAIN
jgi:peptide/nickel transport system permease protein